jgi:hypothetical protein
MPLEKPPVSVGWWGRVAWWSGKAGGACSRVLMLLLMLLLLLGRGLNVGMLLTR